MRTCRIYIYVLIISKLPSMYPSDLPNILPGSMNCLVKAPCPAPGMVDSLISIKLGTENFVLFLEGGTEMFGVQGSRGPCRAQTSRTLSLHCQQTERNFLVRNMTNYKR